MRQEAFADQALNRASLRLAITRRGSLHGTVGQFVHGVSIQCWSGQSGLILPKGPHTDQR